MGANVGPWTQKYYGKRLTPQQFLANRAAQDAVVRGVLGGYVKKYGYRGAASAWYSGNPNLHNSTRSQPGGPSIKGYVDSVMNRAAGYKGGSSGVSDAGTAAAGSGTPAQPKLDRAELAEQYGLSAALINSSAELKKLFEQAVAGQWSPARFQASLKNSKWWKNQSSSLRKYITLKHTDPATWRQNYGNAEAKINALAVQLGLASQFTKGKGSDLLKQAVYNSLALGWSDDRIKDWLGSKVTLHGDIMWGEAGDAYDKLHEVAYLNGVQYSNSWYESKVREVMAGKLAQSTLEDQIRSAAAGKFSAFREQIMAGQNALDLAAPYLKTVSQLLELAESDVDLFNPHVSKAMTGSKGVATPLWQFEREVRSDPLWRKTNNGRESMMTVAHSVAKDFGMAW
ncbi:hypothetical protein [Streptomyces sp. t39]|uniref:hypothetical protein n=1 Tax=Streptomyces sp. t39 TaxID=1828156 RepID=UPI0011CE912A|nr:hypothetical protein [Streptomyces sp. t39]